MESPSSPSTSSAASTASQAPKSRARFIRRPESLQSPEEQRKSIQLSLQHRTAAQVTGGSGPFQLRLTFFTATRLFSSLLMSSVAKTGGNL